MSKKVKYVVFGFLIYEGVAFIYNNYVAQTGGPYLPLDLGTMVANEVGLNLGGSWS